MKRPCSTLFGLWTDHCSTHEKTVLDFIWLTNRPLLDPWKDRARLYLAYEQTIARPMKRLCSTLFGLWTDTCSTHEKTVLDFIWLTNRTLLDPWKDCARLYLAYEQTLARPMKRPCSTLFGLWTDPCSTHEKTVLEFIWLINRPLLDPWKDRARLYLAYEQTIARPMKRLCSNLFGLWTDPCSTHEETVLDFIWLTDRPLLDPWKDRARIYLAYD